MAGLFTMHEPVFEKLYTSLGENTELHDAAGFNLAPHRFLDFVHNLKSTNVGGSVAVVPSARDIFYRQHHDGSYILRKPEYEAWTRGRVFFRNYGNQPITLQKPDEGTVIFRNFDPILEDKQTMYIEVTSDHNEVKDPANAVLDLLMVSQYPSDRS